MILPKLLFENLSLHQGVIMFTTAIVAHFSERQKNTDVTRFCNNLFAILAALVLVIVGVSVL